MIKWVAIFVALMSTYKKKKRETGKMQKPEGSAIWNLWVIENYLFFPKRIRNHLNTYSYIDKNSLLVSALLQKTFKPFS